MIIKLNAEEMAELAKYSNGPFGERGFECLMTALAVRMDGDTGEIDVDRDDLEAIETYKQSGHKKVLERILKRPLDEFFKEFLGR